MPIARVQLADGRIARFDVPEGTTEAQILDLVNQIPQQEQPQRLTKRPTGRGAGAGQVIEARAQALEAIRQQNPILAEEIENLSGPEAFFIGAGQGFTTIGQGVKRLFGGEAEPTPEAIRQLQSVRPAAQAGEVVAEAAPFLVPGLGVGRLATQTSRVAASAALGGAEGGLIAAGRGGDQGAIATGALTGVLIGGGGEALLPVLNSLGRSLTKSKGNVISPDGTITNELQGVLESRGASPDDLVQAAQEIQAGGDIAGNAQRQAVFDKLGITPTEAQRTRDVDLFVEQQDQFRKTGKVRQALDLQETQLTERVAEAVTNTGGTGSTVNAIDAVTDRSLRLDGEISQLYTEARSRIGPESNVRPVLAIESLRTNAPRNTPSNGIVNALRDEMSIQGVAADKGFKVAGRMNVDQAESLRQFANSLFDGANAQGRLIIRDFKQGLDDDVFKAAGEDVFKSARQAKTNFERGLSKEAKNKFDRNRVSLVRDLLENKIAPEELFNKAVRGKSVYKAADLEELKRYLQHGNAEDVARGQEAWNNLRSEAMISIRDTAFTGPIRADGSQSLSRAKLETALKNIGNDKMRVLFSREERQFLKDLSEIAALREPPPGTFTGSGPSSLAVDRLRQSLNAAWGIGDVVDNLGGRLRSVTAERRVLKLANDAERIQKQNAKNAFDLLRKSQLGEAAGAIPFTIIPAAQGEEQ